MFKIKYNVIISLDYNLTIFKLGAGTFLHRKISGKSRVVLLEFVSIVLILGNYGVDEIFVSYFGEIKDLKYILGKLNGIYEES